jgi:ATP-dependent HslUV protease ATP-binding subunit HslU
MTTNEIAIVESDKEDLTPKQIVEELDAYIIGQKNAKRAVAIALRNRMRRRKLDPSLQEEIYPKNIIMIGPTGVGKTEIARRLAKLTHAPFLKVEATKYTEIGYVGRDVESMIRDLSMVSLNIVKNEARQKVKEDAASKAEEVVLDILIPEPPSTGGGFGFSHELQREEEERKESYLATREMMRRKLRSGKINDQEIEIELTPQSSNLPMFQIMGAGNMEDMDNHIQNILGDLMSKKNKKRKLPISEAMGILSEQEAEKLLDMEKVNKEAVRRVEEMGIVFIDEIDKVAGKENRSGADVSREGVQRDLLPIVEGATVNTKIGPIKTDHILFIAAGAFHISKPSDLIPELQGRFPIRVELEKLTQEDFKKILTAPRSSLMKQYQALLGVEGVQLEFSDDGVDEIAKIAYEVNEKSQNIGARRLNTILEKVLEDISFNAPDLKTEEKILSINSEFVKSRLDDIVSDKDLSKYIL